MSYALFVVSALLLGGGLFLVVTRRNAVAVLIGVELILNAALLNLAAFNAQRPHDVQGQGAALFIMVLAAAEAAVALAIVLNLYRLRRSVTLDEASELKG